MTPNDLKKGTRIRLRNGWYGTMADNMKGNTRLVDVEGDFREIGSVYATDIVAASIDGQGWVTITPTPAMLKAARARAKWGF